MKLDDAVRKDKQLDAAHGLHLVAWRGADKKVDETFGKMGPPGTQLVVLTDKPDHVWAAKGYSGYLYSKEAKDFRDKQLLKFDDASASQVTIVNTHGTMSFTKADKWVGTFNKAPIARFDDGKIKNMISAYKSLNADDFGDGKSLAETGLDKPDGTVTVELKDGAGRYELLVGKVSTGTNHWAKRVDSDTIFQIKDARSEWAASDQPLCSSSQRRRGRACERRRGHQEVTLSFRCAIVHRRPPSRRPIVHRRSPSRRSIVHRRSL